MIYEPTKHYVTETYIYKLPEPVVVGTRPTDRVEVHSVRCTVEYVIDNNQGAQPEPFVSDDTYGIELRKDGKPDGRKNFGKVYCDWDWRQQFRDAARRFVAAHPDPEVAGISL